MRRVVLLLVAGAAAVAVAQDPPKPDPGGKKDEPRLTFPELFQERGKLHQRQTGALLTITAKWETRNPAAEPGIVIEWQIDYDGPRRPFTILKPMTYPPGGRSAMHFWYMGPDGKAVRFEIPLVGVGKQWPAGKEGYAVSEGGKPVTGRISAGGASYLRGRIGRVPEPGDPRLWVQLEHAPTDRGDGYDMVFDPATGRTTRGAAWTLDAWTGHLWSPVVEVGYK
jgi:hypothetical protein